jgi:hypothetical protein
MFRSPFTQQHTGNERSDELHSYRKSRMPTLYNKSVQNTRKKQWGIGQISLRKSEENKGFFSDIYIRRVFACFFCEKC